MQRIWVGRVLAAAAVIGLTVTAASADEATLHATAKLSGFQEVTPKLTDGTGRFSATLTGGNLTYTLTYSDLSTPAFMAHIHFAQRGVNGGIFIWLCGSATAPGPAGTPTCPPGGGTVTRTITAAAIQAVPDQAVPADVSFAGVVRILESGSAYANVHTTRFPGGEIRWQIKTDTDNSE
jgi:CHRD domain-containing protein